MLVFSCLVWHYPIKLYSCLHWCLDRLCHFNRLMVWYPYVSCLAAYALISSTFILIIHLPFHCSCCWHVIMRFVLLNTSMIHIPLSHTWMLYLISSFSLPAVCKTNLRANSVERIPCWQEKCLLTCISKVFILNLDYSTDWPVGFRSSSQYLHANGAVVELRNTPNAVPLNPLSLIPST